MNCVLQVGKNNTSYSRGYYYVEGGENPTPYIHRATVYDSEKDFVKDLLQRSDDIWNVIFISDIEDCGSQTPYFDCYEKSRRLNYV